MKNTSDLIKTIKSFCHVDEKRLNKILDTTEGMATELLLLRYAIELSETANVKDIELLHDKDFLGKDIFTK